MAEDHPANANAPGGDTGPTLEETLRASSQAAARQRWAGRILARGAEIGRYVVLSHLGTGGMGIVYAAYDPELDRKVAVKLLKSDASGSHGRARLLREAQALAKLAHPNVVAVHDVGTVDDQVFVAMEFVQGTTLGGWLWARPRRWPEIVDLFVDVARGLQAAHAAGLVHRDLKPDNIMVGDDRRVRVMDFGLARAELDAGARDGERPREQALGLDLTREGVWLGTPMYMAPEQWRGEATDARTDQFSFCVALWEALHGERPFRGDTLVALMTAVTEGTIAPPTDPSKSPPWLRRALERGLQVAPEQRWPSMAALIAELQRDREARWPRWAPAAAVAGMIAAVAFAVVRGREEPTVDAAAVERARIESLHAAALEAGARGRWVYGTLDDPQGSSYRHVRALESLRGPMATDATARARELRQKFFRSLVEFGDSYHQRPGGRLFAAEFYAQASVFAFDVDGALVVDGRAAAERALAHSGLTRAMLATLRRDAEAGTFSPVEIQIAEELAELAEPAAAAAEEAASPAPPPCPSGMARIEGGSLGGRAVDEFCLDVTEVTVAAFQRCVARGLCTPADSTELHPPCNSGREGAARHPINCVDWAQARAFCASVGKRLPSEAEWEWAARGRDEGRRYPWGDGPPSCRSAVIRGEGGDGCGKDGTWRVGSKPAGDSRDGLKDMSGNVWEWTANREGERAALRGGDWLDFDEAKVAASGRMSALATSRSLGFGIRCARSVRR